MEEIVTCTICAQEFENIQVIPKMLECGHTFCSPCLRKLFQKSPSCPNCRAEIKGTESSLPINYNTLKVVDIYKSKCWSVREITTSIDILKKECMKRKNIISKKRNYMTSSLDILDKCLEKLGELTLSESKKTDIVSAKKILNEIDEELKKTNGGMRCDDIKNSVSILLSSFKDWEEFLTEIYKRVHSEEKVFTVHKIGDEVKYGRVSKYENKLFFHSLTLPEVPSDSSLIWFEELKQCVNDKNFYTFIEIFCNKKSITKMVIIKMFDKQQSHHFIKTCTGEYGPSYKGTFFKKGNDNANSTSVLSVENFIENGHQSNRTIDYNFCNGTSGHYTFNVDQMFLYIPNIKGFFEIGLVKKAVNAGCGIVGRVVSPTNLSDSVNYEQSSLLKIVDCGIILEI